MFGPKDVRPLSLNRARILPTDFGAKSAVNGTHLSVHNFLANSKVNGDKEISAGILGRGVFLSELGYRCRGSH